MYRSILFRVILALVLIGAMVGLGAYVYNVGVARGLAQAVQLPAGNSGQTPNYPYFMMPYGRPFFGFGGFGFLGCLIPLFLLFLIFGAFRGMFWHGRWARHSFRHGPWGDHPMADKTDWEKGVPPMFGEWHRRAHETPPAETPEK